MGKETPFLVDRIVEWLEDDAYWTDREKDEKTIREMAEEERRVYLANIHKRAGYCCEILEMESLVLPIESMVRRLSEIVKYSDSCKTIRKKEERDLHKRHELSIVSILRVGKLILFKKRGRQ
jgi:hypothetical protein